MELLDPKIVKQKISDNTTLLIDIRSNNEYLSEHIDGAININPDDIKNYNYKDKNVIFYCLSGVRTQRLKEKLITLPSQKSFIMKDGINGWKIAGYTTVKNHKYHMTIMQQVQVTISLLLFISLLLSYTISPWFSLIILCIATGLMVAGITGFCGMAAFLSKMPWNRT